MQLIPEKRQQLKSWFAEDLGHQLLLRELGEVNRHCQPLLKHVVLQIGTYPASIIEDWADVRLPIVLEMFDDDRPGMKNLLAEPELLPLANQSVNLILMPHALDFATDAHELLREVSRVITPEGHVIITGFNPISLWGLRRIIARRSSPVPWCGQFYRSGRVQDWLTLLGFELVAGSMCYYRPPCRARRLREYLQFLETMGHRWWPLLGAVYILVARKHEKGARPILLGRRWRKRWQPGLVHSVRQCGQSRRQ